MQSDPIGIGGSVNTYAYAYASGNSLHRIDKLGLCDECFGLKPYVSDLDKEWEAWRALHDEYAMNIFTLMLLPIGGPEIAAGRAAGYSVFFETTIPKEPLNNPTECSNFSIAARTLSKINSFCRYLRSILPLTPAVWQVSDAPIL